MTAEIAILNRTAVALAADSVVTLAGSGGRKTYDSAEKIFQLSRYQPIGLMIYNNAQFMNAPLEVLARSYRATLTANAFERLEQVWKGFSEYLLAFDHLDADEEQHLRSMARVELEALRMVHFNYKVDAIGRRSRKGRPTGETIIADAIATRLKEATAAALPSYLSDRTLSDFIARYAATIDPIIDIALDGLDLDGGLRASVHELLFALVRSSIRTQQYTGFVFAGFGTKDIFPTLRWLEADGVYFGEFRIIAHGLKDIDRRGETAAVVPFAQTDMAERFMVGIDQTFERALARIVSSIVGQVLEGKPRAFPLATRERILAAADMRFREGLDQLKDGSERALRAVVDHLSKKELGEVAYSLVELTSRKRRYSAELETVGGPIDVAILTRNEGFVWVRRKHYFNAELNPQYVAGLSGGSGLRQ